MLCAFEDQRGRQAQKYWPQRGEGAQYQEVGVVVRTVTQTKNGDYVTTKIELEGVEGKKTVDHIHWLGWGDFKKPLGQDSENIFRGLVQECVDLAEKKELFLVHCSAGVGRTGTLGAVIEGYRSAKSLKAVSIFEIVDYMRKHRNHCVQTIEQYCFIYDQVKRLLG